MKKLYNLLLVALLCATFSFAQSQFPPVEIGQGTFLGESIPLRDFEKVPEGIPEDWRIIPNNTQNIPKANAAALPLGDDPLIQTGAQYRGGVTLDQNFQGITRGQAGGAVPPDPSGAVGPDHYVHAVNLAVVIFDKQGTVVVPPVSLGAFFGNGVNNGDPIVMYDQLADRFFVSQFRISTNGLIIAVSTTSDPTGTYNVYEYSLSSFPDYPHYSIWHDAYYLTANKSGQVAYALDRQAMIDGDPSPGIVGFSVPGLIRRPSWVLGVGPVGLTGTDIDTNAPGYLVYLQDDGWSGAITFDHLKIWELTVDFVTPANSTISAPAEIATTPFDSTFFSFGSGDVTQPGTGVRLDNIGSIVSYMTNYRSFPTHNSLLVNFNVDLGSQRSGIRWFELRNVNNGPWSIFQEGTYDLNDGENRFMGSMAMDEGGNIGMAYNFGSSSTAVGIRFTGRFDGDPLGDMTVAETVIQDGIGIQTITNRFGDYSQLTMDPNGGQFWYTGEFFITNNNWATKIAAFTLDPSLGVDESLVPQGSLEVYPVGTDQYQLFVNANYEIGELMYEMYDMNGRVIMNGAMDSSAGDHRQLIPTGNLSKGVYIVKVFNNTFEQTKKFILR